MRLSQVADANECTAKFFDAVGTIKPKLSLIPGHCVLLTSPATQKTGARDNGGIFIARLNHRLRNPAPRRKTLRHVGYGLFGAALRHYQKVVSRYLGATTNPGGGESERFKVLDNRVSKNIAV